MRKSDTVFHLALQRLRYHRSRTLLTGIAILLTTMLLMAIGTIVVAIFSMHRQMASETDYHAIFKNLTPDQSAVLSRHIQVEALSTTEIFADIENGKMNGALIYQESIRDDRYANGENSLITPQLESGHYPEAEDEICSSPAFFRRIGTEPTVGGKVTLSFRISGKGEILSKEFTISGLFADVEIAEGIDDSRIMWGAHVSKTLLSKYREDDLYQPNLSVYLRVYGEDDLTYDEMVNRINAAAADIGLNEENVILNKEYLVTATDPGTDVIVIAGVICLIVILFSSLVIYSIYYVGVITDVQEIGKLRALGASGRQIAGLLYCQGAVVSAFAIPAGLLVGFLLPHFLFPLVLRAYRASALNSNTRDAADALIGQIHMFSLPVLLTVAAAVAVTVCLSLLKPIRMARRITPVEAIRYQENSTDRKTRKGHRQVQVATLTFANLSRNKRRTAVTILTMGLSCVLFICVSSVLSSVSAEDMARRNIEKGDFRISLEYHNHDAEYPENNLDSLVQKNYFNDTFLAQLTSIEGVESVERRYGRILSSTEIASALYDACENRLSLSCFTREDIAELNANLKQGSIDYDRMTANRELLFTHEYTFHQYGLSIGDVFPLTLYDGDRKIPFTATLTALSEPNSIDLPFLIMTEDTWNELGLVYDPTTDIYLYVKDAQYDSVKEALTEIVAENEYFTLYSMDVEMRIGRAAVGLTIYPIYLLLALIAVIGFINLINTMITSIVTRKRELGILQAIGLSDRQLVKMLSGEGLIFTAGTLLISLTLGNLCGYLLFLWAKEYQFMSISRYHYPLWESIGLVLVLLGGQLLITRLISRKMEKESLIDRIRDNV